MSSWGITLFDSYDKVKCHVCRILISGEPYPPAHNLGTGSHCKRCPKCKLVTTYDLNMSPLEAGAIDLEEPDWRERVQEHANRWPKLPDFLAWDNAFEATMTDWRRFHGADVETNGEKKRRPAPAVDAMIALAGLRIFPARHLIKDVPRGGEPFEEQHDAHLWLIMSQRAWRITGVEDKTMILDSFGEQTQVDLSRAKWEKHTEKAVEALMAQRKKDPPENATTPADL